MKLTYDPDADAVYLLLGETQIVDSETVAPGVVLDYDENENIVGLEMLNVSKRVGKLDTQRMLMETLSAKQTKISMVREFPSTYGESEGTQ